MLPQLIADPLLLGAAQVGIAVLLALLVVVVIRLNFVGMMSRGAHTRTALERDVVVAIGRGLVQIIAVGAVLGLLLQRSLWIGAITLVVMVNLAATIAARRGSGIPGAFRVAVLSIGGGAGIVIILTTWTGVIAPTIASLIPIGSIMIANAMNTCGQTLDRFHSDVQAHRDEIEAGLALGAAPTTTLFPYVQAAVSASLLPRIDALRSLGIVWIPGIMAGMVLAGSNPVHAALYQFVIMTLIFTTGSIAAILTTFLIQSQIFSAAEQLTLPEAQPGAMQRR